MFVTESIAENLAVDVVISLIGYFKGKMYSQMLRSMMSVEVL